MQFSLSVAFLLQFLFVFFNETANTEIDKLKEQKIGREREERKGGKGEGKGRKKRERGKRGEGGGGEEKKRGREEKEEGKRKKRREGRKRKEREKEKCFLSSRRRNTRAGRVTGVQKCALPISKNEIK